jgi:hypothetical protein
VQGKISCRIRKGSVGDAVKDQLAVQGKISWRCREGSVGVYRRVNWGAAKDQLGAAKDYLACTERSVGLQRRIIWGCRVGLFGGAGKNQFGFSEGSFEMLGRIICSAGKDQLGKQ